MLNPVKLWRNQGHIRRLLGRRGTIVSYTTVRAAPEGFVEHAPYVTAVVLLDNGQHAVGQLVDWHDGQLRVGQPVVGVLRRIRQPDDEGIIGYGVKFCPI